MNLIFHETEDYKNTCSWPISYPCIDNSQNLALDAVNVYNTLKYNCLYLNELKKNTKILNYFIKQILAMCSLGSRVFVDMKSIYTNINDKNTNVQHKRGIAMYKYAMEIYNNVVLAKINGDKNNIYSNIIMDESSYTSLIRIYCGGNQPIKAHQLLYKMKNHNYINPKLRSYSALIYYYGLNLQIENGIGVYDELINDMNILKINESEHYMLCDSLYSKNDDRFYEILQTGINRVDLTLTNKFFINKYYKKWFSNVNEKQKEQQEQDCNCDINTCTGKCNICSNNLRSIDLNNKLSNILATQIACIINKEKVYQRQQDFSKFIKWLNKNTNDNAVPYDILIDGANLGTFSWVSLFIHFLTYFSYIFIGYYGNTLNAQKSYNTYGKKGSKNSNGGSTKLNFKQIDNVVEYFLSLNKKILIVLHSRHLVYRNLNDCERFILDKWNTKNGMFKNTTDHNITTFSPRSRVIVLRFFLLTTVIYRVPPRNNDDWYWMFAATTSSKLTYILTNDQMRDHHYQMLSEKYFKIWIERRQIKFDIKKQYGKYNNNNNKYTLYYPPVYSKRMQFLIDINDNRIQKEGRPQKTEYILHVPFTDKLGENAENQKNKNVSNTIGEISELKWLCCNGNHKNNHKQ